MRFKNPIIPGFHPDPSICRAGDDYCLAVVRELLADEAAHAVLDRHVPAFARGEIPAFMATMPLIDLGVIAPDQFPFVKLRAIAADLRQTEHTQP